MTEPTSDAVNPAPEFILQTEFTAETARKIIHHIENGLPPAQAADLCFVPPDTMDDWICDRPDFLAQVRWAEARDIERTFARMMRGRHHWRLFAWKLERRYPHLFSVNPEDHPNNELDPENGPRARNKRIREIINFKPQRRPC